MSLPPQVILSDFVPQSRLISDVTNAVNAVVTTTTDHEFETGYVVRVIVPRSYGMSLYKQTKIIVLSPTTFSTELNTLYEDVFSAPSYPPVFTPAQVIPITGVEDNIAGAS